MNDLYSLIERVGKKLNSKNAIIEDQYHTNWEELLDKVSDLSERLKNLGATPSDIALIEIDTSVEFIIALLASIKCSLIVAPVSPTLKPFERSKALEIIKPNFFVTLDSLDKKKFSISKSEKVYNLNPRLREIGLAGGFIRLTSGTTGDAKGVFISTNKAVERVRVTCDNFKLNESDTVLNLLPLPYHFIAALLSFLVSGTTIVITSKSKTNFISEIYNQITTIYAAPFHYDSLCNAKGNNAFPNLRLALSTAIGLSKRTFDTFYNLFKIPILQSYGIIELGIPIGEFEEKKKDQFTHSIGKALDRFNVKLVEQDSNNSNQGILAIAGPGFFDAYLEPFVEANKILKDGYFISGDFARIEDNQIILQGRASSALNIAGFKVFPDEIENVILQLPEVLEVQVKGIPHEIFGTSLVAEIVFNGSQLIEISDIKKHCKRHLDNVKVPHEYLVVDELKRNAAGKLIRGIN